MQGEMIRSGLAFAALLSTALAAHAQAVTAPAARMSAPTTPAIRSPGPTLTPTGFSGSFGATSFALLSWSYVATNPSGPAPGASAGQTARAQEVDIVRYVDATSAVLTQQMVGGKGPARATLTITGYRGTQGYVKLVFADAVLVSRSLDAALGAARPQERLRFRYAQASETYTP
ncbi:MAG TPA: type VI secretion system tube protein Hcp [Steroidobacteraceae bacterium]|nr:type VI secretion system tube protein Hcp [Steroidobacteraceae bacterium]